MTNEEVTNTEKEETMELRNFREQILHKDNRIIQLNNIILERERQIIDLQEMCSEQGKVAQSKSLAMHIVNKRLQELDAKQTKETSTETDPIFVSEHSPVKIKLSGSRRISPGRAIAQFKFTNGNGSPPPLDPAEDNSSCTTEPIVFDNEELFKNKKYKKKVTFDVDNDNGIPKPKGIEQSSMPRNRDVFPTDYEELLIENDHLRQIISQMEKDHSSDASPNNKIERSVSSQILRVKAAAQAKIKEMESMNIQTKLKADAEIADLRAIIEQLNQSRECAYTENTKLIDQLTISKQKCEDLLEELDASMKTTDVFRKRVNDSAMKLEEMMTESHHNRALIQQLTDEKFLASNEVERLKEAIIAQDEFISLLEGDLIVYEAHVGILRDSLGASKKEDRQNIKSKAFTAKINALETEKQEIVKRNNEDKLRAKALLIKVRCLEQEKDEIKARLRQVEKEHEKIQPNEVQLPLQQKEFASIETMTDYGDVFVSEVAQLKEKLCEAMQQNSLLLAKIDQINTQNIKLSHDSEELLAIILKFFESMSENISLFSNNDQFDDPVLHMGDYTTSYLSKKLAIIESNCVRAFETLNDKKNLLTQQIYSQQIEIQSKENSYKQIEEDKQKLESELQMLKEEFLQTLAKITLKDEQIGTLEERTTGLLCDLSNLKRQLESDQYENSLLSEAKISLEEQLSVTNQKLQDLCAESDTLKLEFYSIKTDRDSLARTLYQEQERLNKLIRLLRDIVERFGSGLELFSSDYIENLIKENTYADISERTTMTPTPTTLTESTREYLTTEQQYSLAMPATTTLSKTVQVNLLENENKFDELCRIIDAQQDNLCSLKLEIEELQNKLQKNESEFVDCINQRDGLQIEYDKLKTERDILIIERDDLLRKTIDQSLFNNQLEELQKNLKIELTELRESRRLEQEQFRVTQKNLHESCTQTNTIVMEEHFMQTDIPEVDDAAIQSEIVTKSILIQTEEILINNTNNAETQMQNDLDKVSQQHLDRQQSHQLLMDCIHDRQEMERDFDDNVQQLLELKSELEASVDVLKGEIWSLNEELKKRFDERNYLNTKLCNMEEFLKDLQVSNETMRKEIQEKNVDLVELSTKLEDSLSNESKMEKHIEELNSLVTEKARKIDVLQNMLNRLKQIIEVNVKMWNGDLDYLRHMTNENTNQFHLSIDNITSTIQHYKAFLLQQSHFRPFNCPKCLFHLDDNIKLAILAAKQTTMAESYDVLLRENSELIEMNKNLQQQLEQNLQEDNKIQDGCNNSTCKSDVIKDGLTLNNVMPKKEEFYEINTEFQFAYENTGISAETNISIVFDEKLMVSADVDLFLAEQKHKLEENVYNEAEVDEKKGEPNFTKQTDELTNTIIDSETLQMDVTDSESVEKEEANAVVNWDWDDEDEEQKEDGDMISPAKEEFDQTNIQNTLEADWSWNNDGEEEDKEHQQKDEDETNTPNEQQKSVKFLFDDW